jgi:ribosomal protein S18 acetylase RimI-like enzyme
MPHIERLEKFWRDLTLLLPESVVLDDAVVLHNLGMPIPAYNHVTNVHLREEEVEKLLGAAIDHFASKRLPFTCFRVSPLTHPPSFLSSLESHGFGKEFEQSIMVFNQEPQSAKPNLAIEIKELSIGEMNIYDELVFQIFGMPVEWKGAMDSLILEMTRRGGKIYLAYAQGKPVGTATLFSHNHIGCIFTVGTLTEYRRQGIATALMNRAILDSVDDGNDLHTLQTIKGEGAERLYQRLGFDIDHTVAYYVMNMVR